MAAAASHLGSAAAALAADSAGRSLATAGTAGAAVPAAAQAAAAAAAEAAASGWGAGLGFWPLARLVLLNGACYCCYNCTSFVVLGRVSFVTHATLNVMRRTWIIAATSWWFGVAMDAGNVAGIALALGGFAMFLALKVAPHHKHAAAAAAAGGGGGGGGGGGLLPLIGLGGRSQEDLTE